MSKQSKLERNSIHLGDSLQVMAVMPDASVDMVSPIRHTIYS